MIKRPFVLFVLVVASLIAGLIGYLQSPSFARLAKQVMAQYVPKDLGIEGDFSELKVKWLPPGLAIVRPRLKLLEHNVLGLPAGSQLSAERVDLAFRPVQMFSRNIRVHEVTIVGGDVNLLLGDLSGAGGPGSKKRKKSSGFHWDELFQVHAEAFSVVDTHVRVQASSPAIDADFVAESARVGQWSSEGGLGYEIELELNRIHGTLPGTAGASLPRSLDRLGATVHVNASGLQAERLEVALPGGVANVSGRIRGSLLDPKSLLNFTAQASAHADLARLLESLPHEGRQVAAEGQVDFTGKLSGALDRPFETLKVDGKLGGKDLKLGQWYTDTLAAELGWQASPRGGELSVTQATLTAREQERSGGMQPGAGGRIEVGAFKADLGALLAPVKGSPPASVTVPLTLERAHLHWLGAGALKKVYPLDLRASGPVKATFKPAAGAHPWELAANVDLDIDRFQLDNQRLGEVKALRRVLKVPKIHLDGDVALDASAFRLVNVNIGTGTRTSFQGMGAVDFRTGFDLFFSGSVDLAEVGQIAENDIRGQGDLEVRVHGPLSAPILDFDPDLKDAYYLKLRLGDLKGRITWDDGENHLLFSRIQATRGRTTYDAEGMIDLDGPKDNVDIGVRVPIGEIEDMIHVFDDLTDDLWWFPRELTGPVHGDVRISGAITMDRLTVGARINGTDWQYRGERFASVQLQGGYDRGTYQITDFAATKRLGRAYGRISFDADRVMDWALHTENFTLADLDHVAQLDVPMRGKLTVESSGRGREGAIKSATSVRLDDYSVRGAQMAPSELAVSTEGGKAEVHGLALGGQGRLEALYDFEPGGRSRVHGELRHLDFTPGILIINPKLIQDRNLAGTVSGSVDLSFLSGRMERASGGVELSEYHLAKTGARYDLSHPLSFKVADGTFDISDLSLKGVEGESTLSLHGNHSQLEGLITGEIDTSIVEFLTSAIADADGTAVLDFSLGGSLKAPTVFGKATYDGVTVKMASLESPFENCSGTLQLRQNVLSVQNAEADLAGGRLTAEGTVQLFADRYPVVDLKSTLSGPKLKVYPFQFVKVRGDVDVHGDKLPYLVEGDIAVESALSTEKVLNQGKSDALKALQYTPPPTRTSSADYPMFKLNLHVSADGGVMIRNDLFDAEAKGNLNIVNTLEAPRILGTAELVGGHLNFKDRTFQIQSANATFDNPSVINPTFTVTGSTEVKDYKIQLYASGKLDNVKIELTSNPVLPEPEILSLLATGMTSDSAKLLSASDRAAMEQGEAATALLQALDFNRDVQSKTGVQIGLEEGLAPQQSGLSVSKPQTGADSIAQPKIVLKRKVTDNFVLSFGQTVSNSTTTFDREFTGEYQLTPAFSVLGVFDNYETVDTIDHTSIGADIKFQTRFR